MASANDMKAAESTYGGFLTLLKYGTIAAVVTVAVVIALIV